MCQLSVSVVDKTRSLSLFKQIQLAIRSHSPIGVATRLVASTPAHAESIRCVGVTSIGTGAAAISSDRHWKGIHEKCCWGSSISKALVMLEKYSFPPSRYLLDRLVSLQWRLEPLARLDAGRRGHGKAVRLVVSDSDDEGPPPLGVDRQQ